MVRMESGESWRKHLKGRYFILAVVASVLMAASVVMDQCGCGSGFSLGIRNYGRHGNVENADRWAERVKFVGVPNFHKVADGLYRGGQPSAQGIQELGGFGIKTVVNLRSAHSDRKKLSKTSLQYEEMGLRAEAGCG